MNSAEYVKNQLQAMKESGLPLVEIAWKIALLCVGWAYVYGARGEYCTPGNRRSRYSDAHPTIKTACKNYNGSSSAKCAGCKWYPGDKYTRFYDCRGFTYWVLKQVYGWELVGAGCTSQWNTKANWKAKGEVKDGIPQNTIVCLFYYKKDSKGKRTTTLSHTGLYYNGQTVECSSGVQHSKTLNKKWEVWGIPACVDGVVPEPTPAPTPEPKPETDKPTLRRGSKGKYVTLAQTELINKGYSCGKSGADGSFGADTEKAVKAFQRDHTDEKGKPLAVDGVIGQKTWNALDGAEPAIRYTVTIPGLTGTQADALVKQFPNSTKTEERG